ncbi:MAG: ribonuclease H [Candidatus Kapaibacterium sp.]
MREIVIHTDGSCLSNPGRGGWAVVIEDHEGRRELCGGARLTTNNRMEIRAAIEALRATPIGTESLVTVTTDSQLLVNSVEKGWAAKWRANRWMRNRTDKAENPDLWGELLTEIEQRRVRFVWTKAHVGTIENERCDFLAKAAAENASDVDTYYERQRPSVSEQTRMFTAAPAQARPGYSVSVHPVTRAVTISHPERGSIDIPGEELLSFLETVRSTIVGSHGKY